MCKVLHSEIQRDTLITSDSLEQSLIVLDRYGGTNVKDYNALI